MPVLMNKGPEPRRAAWLFYTDRATLDGLGAAARRERFDAGVLTVDKADLDAAPKASTEVPVYLAVATLVPEGFDLEAYIEEAGEQGGDVAEAPEPEGRKDGGLPDEGAGAASGQAGGDSGEEAAPGDEDEGEEEGSLPYEPEAAPEGTRVPVGLTTAAAARAYIIPREVDGKPWAAELPGLPMLVSLIDYMRGHGGLPAFAVWHVDPQGILRMAPAKQVRPMAGNILNVRL